jgi:hypothetical protein
MTLIVTLLNLVSPGTLYVSLMEFEIWFTFSLHLIHVLSDTALVYLSLYSNGIKIISVTIYISGLKK